MKNQKFGIVKQDFKSRVGVSLVNSIIGMSVTLLVVMVLAVAIVTIK